MKTGFSLFSPAAGNARPHPKFSTQPAEALTGSAPAGGVDLEALLVPAKYTH